MKLKSQLSKMIITFLVLFSGVINVQAVDTTCSYKEKAALNELSRKIKTSYEVEERTETIEGEGGPMDVYLPTFKISIYNITEDVYLTQHNSVTNETEYIFFEGTQNGVYTFVDEDFTNIVKYTYKIYANLESCAGETLRTYSFMKPKSNGLSKYGVCEGHEDIPYCQPYITKELDVKISDLKVKIDEYLSDRSIKPPSEEETGILEFLKNNWLYVTIGAVVVIGATGGTIYYIRKRRVL